MLSHGFRERRFGGQASAIGSPVILNGRPFTIVGVAPPSFAGTEIGQSPDVFAPMAMQPVLLPDVGNALAQPRNNWLRMIGRLKKDVDTAIAVAVLATAGAFAAWVEARRASKVDPIRALRYE
jgi:hypothetical protein